MSNVAQQAWRRGLDALCQYNGVIELIPFARDESVPPGHGHRVRVFEVEQDGSIIVEKPAAGESVGAFVDGALVQLLMSDPLQRWMGVCEVVETLRHPLNDRTKVSALRLSAAGDVQSAQRRAFFRVDTAGMPLEITVQSRAEPDTGGADDAMALDVFLQNISGGGIGVTVPLSLDTLESLRRRQSWNCIIRLPNVDHLIELDARLVHLQQTSVDTAYLGLEFDGNDPDVQAKAEDQIVRFGTQLQREQLRRQRGA